ncbi:uncharacterized protein VP01_588g1 [Puccinia sorghi]|uniref:DUF659 domain-containing protein n=1 Tax=Puccinia sorghi TaxID=27349 RepID=A0A0L6UJY0_9BASI|nr:uncharacterized protein VP01_588g1 [Puccinia sorghi]
MPRGGIRDTNIPASPTPAVGNMIRECRVLPAEAGRNIEPCWFPNLNIPAQGSQGICLPLISWLSDLKINHRPQPTLTSIPPLWPPKPTPSTEELGLGSFQTQQRDEQGQVPCAGLKEGCTEKSNQLLLPNLLKRQHVEHPVSFFFLIFFFTIIYHALIQILQPIFDLPFSIMERPLFNNLLQLLNPHTKSMEFGCKIRNTIAMMFIAPSKHNLQILSAIKHLSFTVDAWTSPDMKAFMAIKAHGITPEWKILDVLIGMPAVKGRHSGVNFADLLGDTLDKLELSNKLISITTDNTSSNSSLAQHVEYWLGGIFEVGEVAALVQFFFTGFY